MTHRSHVLVILLTALTLILSGSVLALDKVRVSMAGGFDEIGAFEENRVVYVSLSELATVVGGSLDWRTVGHEVRYSDPSFRFDFLIGSSFYTYNDTAYNMTYPAVLKRGQLYLPAATFLPLLDRALPQKVSWFADNKAIAVESEFYDVLDMTVQSKENGVLIEIHLSTTLAYDIFVTEGNWLNISFRDARVNRSRILSRKDSRLMYSLEVHQVENNTGQISMRLKQPLEKWHHKIEHNPTRLQIAIQDVTFALDTGSSRPEVGPDDKIDVIIVDAGHGGEDYGAVGRNGTKEKDVTLGIAKRLANKIRKDKEFKVIMTRDRDVTVSLEERAKIANREGADLFVSIHANASPKQNVQGWNVFFLAPALNDSARAVEQLENSYFLRERADTLNDSQTEDLDPVMGILNEMIMTEFQTESYDFAMMIDREFRRQLKTKSRGVDQAGFFVLNKVFTPSVLIESAFISNPVEEKLLKDKAYQEQVAGALYEAIKRFKVKYESR